MHASSKVKWERERSLCSWSPSETGHAWTLRATSASTTTTSSTTLSSTSSCVCIRSKGNERRKGTKRPSSTSSVVFFFLSFWFSSSALPCSFYIFTPFSTVSFRWCQAISIYLPPKPSSAFFLMSVCTTEFVCTYMLLYTMAVFCMHDYILTVFVFSPKPKKSFSRPKKKKNYFSFLHFVTLMSAKLVFCLFTLKLVLGTTNATATVTARCKEFL